MSVSMPWQMACPGCLQGGGSNSKPFADFQHDTVSVLPINCVKCHYMARYQALVCVVWPQNEYISAKPVSHYQW